MKLRLTTLPYWHGAQKRRGIIPVWIKTEYTYNRTDNTITYRGNVYSMYKAHTTLNSRAVSRAVNGY